MLGDPLPDLVDGLVSIVIPTYNQEEFVEETIESVLSQTYKNVEIIITDDGSVDDTARIIESYANRFPSKIIPVLNGTNVGIAGNLNKGLERVRGEYIAWLGGDDIMLPTKLEEQVQILAKRHDAVGCCHDAEVFDSESGETIGHFSKLYNGKCTFREGGVELWFNTSYHMLPSTVMIRSSVVPEGGFDNRLRFANDWLFDIEVFRQGMCVPINKILAKYRRHEKNVSRSPQAKAINTEEAMIALAIIDARHPDLHRFVKKHRRTLTASACLHSYRNGKKQEMNHYLGMLFGQGAWLVAPAMWVTLQVFGPIVAKQSELARQQRSPIFQKLNKLIKDLL